MPVPKHLRHLRHATWRMVCDLASRDKENTMSLSSNHKAMAIGAVVVARRCRRHGRMHRRQALDDDRS